VDLLQFLGILRTRWRFIAAALVIAAVATGAYTFLTPATYASSATLIISTPPTGVLDPYAATTATAQRAQSYANLATDADVLEAAAERLNVDVSPGELSELVSARVVEDTMLLEINAHARSPELAQQTATVVADEVIRLIKEIETPVNEGVPAPIIARLAAKASFNPTPVAPNVPFALVTGLTLSLLAGIAGAVLRDLLDTSVKTAEEVQAIAGTAPIATLPFDPEVREHPLSSDSGGAMSEAFRVLRTNLQFADLDAHRQTILVTSSVPDEGKTFVATNLAISLAKAGRSVLLVDADMRNPNVGKLLGLENTVGMITVLLGRAGIEQAVQPHVSGVNFLGTGPRPPNPAEVLDTQAMRDLLGKLRSAYDIVIVDAPPLLPVADAAILLTEVDGALLLVRHGSTTRSQLKTAVSRIQVVGGRLFGTIVNAAPARGLSSYGYGYYGYGYGDAFGETEADTRRGRRSSGRRAQR
jgi:capsular exopolysaccharide synthesis family protein